MKKTIKKVRPYYPVDTVAASQGVSEAYSANKISQKLYEKVMGIFSEISYVGPVSRRECSYEKLLCKLAKLNGFTPYDIGNLWQYLGKWFAEGIGVGHNSHQCSSR